MLFRTESIRGEDAKKPLRPSKTRKSSSNKGSENQIEDLNQPDLMRASEARLLKSDSNQDNSPKQAKGQNKQKFSPGKKPENGPTEKKTLKRKQA